MRTKEQIEEALKGVPQYIRLKGGENGQRGTYESIQFDILTEKAQGFRYALLWVLEDQHDHKENE